MISLIPICGPRIDWKSYLRVCNEVLGRSPANKLDSQWHTITDSVADFLATLKEIIAPGSLPFDEAGALFDHVHFTFLLIATRSATYSIITTSRLDCTTVNSQREDFNLSIISGTLAQWRTAVLNCCVDDIIFEVREFGTQVINYFEAQNLKLGLKKISMSDGTVRLLEKK
jgi:hypothetical protein